MASTVYATVKNSIGEQGETRGKSPESFPSAIPISSRHEAMMDMYQPYLSVAHDIKWLVPRLAAQKPDRYQAASLPVYLMLHDFAVLRSAIKVSLTDHEHLPDRTEGQRTYTKVCRAKLKIESASNSGKEVQPITLTYSANPPPSGKSPLYLAVNLFEATEAPLPFELSDSEKVALMAMGATRNMQAQPAPQQPARLFARLGLRALRRHIEATEAAAQKVNSP